LSVAFEPGSVSFRSYPHGELDPPGIIAELRAQGALAVGHGFAGVMTSEHHAGFAGYLPNPLQLAGFLLDAMPSGWAAACPLLLPLRPPALVIEETAWLAAHFPGRVGLGVAAGALPLDFEIMATDMHDLAARFADGLAAVTDALRGSARGALRSDPAVARCVEHPVPVVSAAASTRAARRAAAAGAGLLFDSLVTPTRVAVGTPARVAEQLNDALQQSGADALNLRVHVPGITVAMAREQIERLGDGVLPELKGQHATR